jgi:hypothetical protein
VPARLALKSIRLLVLSSLGRDLTQVLPLSEFLAVSHRVIPGGVAGPAGGGPTLLLVVGTSTSDIAGLVGGARASDTAEQLRRRHKKFSYTLHLLARLLCRRNPNPLLSVERKPRRFL